MKKNLFLFVFTVLFASFGHSQTDKTWLPVNDSYGIKLNRIAQRSDFPKEFSLYKVDFNALRALISTATESNGVVISFPNSNGVVERFQVFEHSNFTPELQAQFPEIRAYAGIGLDDKNSQIRFSCAPTGLQTMVFRTGTSNEFMEPYSDDNTVYAVYNSSRTKGSLPFTCSTDDKKLFSDATLKAMGVSKSNNAVYKTMRLALSCTAEYTAAFGGTVSGAQTAMNATMTRCNGVFEKDLAVHLNMIPNASIIYLDPATDPYSDSTVGLSTIAGCTTPNFDCPGTWNQELQNTLISVIGESNYDIGHLFGASGGGGNAGCIGCVCDALRTSNSTPTYQRGKGSGITSPGSGLAAGDTFDIDYVAHEMGHQMGGNHTFSFSTENNAVNVEPGSGSTIMAYAGITGATDVQSNSDDYYTYRSILQIQNNLATKSCPVSTPITPANFAISAGASYTIPKGTPFKLIGSGAANVVSYCWEENDDATTVGAASSYPAATKTDGPNFRSFNPVAVNFRYFPKLATVLSNSLSSTWEATSTVARTLNFTLTGRNNLLGGGQTDTASTVITVSGTTGPFDVTSQATDGISWIQGTSETITWTVNGTTSLAGSTNVDILLSTDGGLTFPTVLAAAVPNNGSAIITVPNVAFVNCRVMVKPTGNVYYDINPKQFAIGYVITTTCNTYTNSTPVTIIDATSSSIPSPTVTSNIVVPAGGVVSSIKVGLNVTHSYPNDLVINLKNPGNTANVNIWNRACGGNNNFNVTLADGSPAFTCVAAMTGTFSPSAPLSSFNGLASNGTWTLSITDFDIPDAGTLNSWFMEICTQSAVLTTENFELADFSLSPNPNNGSFNIKFNSSSNKDISINIFDLRGRAIFNKSYQNTGLFDQNLQLNTIQAGVYLVNVQDGENKIVKKIVVE